MRKQSPVFSSAAARLGVLVFLLGLPLAASAYVGPGAGLSLLSALWGLICAIGAALLFVIMWPIRRLRRRRAEKRRAEQGGDSSSSMNTGDDQAPPATASTQASHRDSPTYNDRHPS